MDDLLMFAQESQPQTIELLDPWKVLIVDDEPDVHTITELVIRGFIFESRPLECYHAYSGAQAYEIIQNTPDIAMAFVDVVMETENAGLDLVRDIREKLDNHLIRIVLRTGQPGQAPEESVIVDYDINDYKSKTELTAIKLKTTLYTSLRSFRDLKIIESYKMGLERVISSLGSVSQTMNISDTVATILSETIKVLNLKNNAVYVDIVSKDHDGSLEEYVFFTPHDTVLTLDDTVIALLNQVLQSGQSLHDTHHYVAYISQDNHNDKLLYVSKNEPLEKLDVYLLEMFASHISIAFKNSSLHEELQKSRDNLFELLSQQSSCKD